MTDLGGGGKGPWRGGSVQYFTGARRWGGLLAGRPKNGGMKTYIRH